MKQFFMDGWITNGRIDRRETATGKTVVTFSVNSSSRRKNQQTGEWEDVPQFFDCKYWSRGGNDFRVDLIKAGEHVAIAGEPTYEEWQAQDGSKRSKTVFVARELMTIEKGKAGRQPQPQAESVYEEDIPF